MYDVDGRQMGHWGSASGTLEQEKVGERERRMVKNTLAVPYRWICSLDIRRPNGLEGKLLRGSGVFIGPGSC
jgi:hypothetical protein